MPCIAIVKNKYVQGMVLGMLIIFATINASVAIDIRILKVVDFELSPDEGKIAFTALTPIGNTDIWVVNIDGKDLKRLTFKEYSPTNRISYFFRKHRWNNFFRIDIVYPSWTLDGKLIFCQRLTRYNIFGRKTISVRYWLVNPDGSGKRPKKDTDKIFIRLPVDPINRAISSVYSSKYKRQIFLKDGILWILNDGESVPQKLIL